jgi:hypothetical protein
VRDHGAQQHVALEPCAGADDRLNSAKGRGETALVVMGAHAPDPAVLELGAIGIDRPSGHLDARIHMTVEHQRRTAAGAAQHAHRLPALRCRIEGMLHIHHRHVETDIAHPLGEMVGDRLLLERRAWNPQQRLLDFQNTLRRNETLHSRQFSHNEILLAEQRRTRRRCGWQCLRLAYSVRTTGSVVSP